MNDCKALAQQLVAQSTRQEKNQKDYDKHQKEIDKEKSKNKVLSELMVGETQKFKERLRQYEEEVRDYHVLEKKKNDLENRLTGSDKQVKDTYHLLNEERKKSSVLMYELNQLRKQYGEYGSNQNNYNGEDEDDILLVQDQYEIPIREARTSTIQLSQPDCDSPEPSTVLPPAIPVRVATVAKSSSIRQIKSYSPQVKSNSSSTVASPQAASNSMNNNQQQWLNYVQPPDGQHMKRHSYDEKTTTTHNTNIGEHHSSAKEEASVKRNSYEGTLNSHAGPTPDSSLHRSSTIKQKPNSYEDMRSVGNYTALSVTPKRNSYEGDSKKVPPPAPPRRGSQLTPQDRPPIVKIPQHFQPRKTNNSSTPSATDAYKQQNKANSSGKNKFPIIFTLFHLLPLYFALQLGMDCQNKGFFLDFDSPYQVHIKLESTL